MDATSAETTIHRYYDALQAGEPLHPFFADDGTVVKVGIGERLVGADAVAAGLRQQTETTQDWVVESRDLRVGIRAHSGADYRHDETGARDGDFAWFWDDVRLAWRDTERKIRFDFETRWTGALWWGDGSWRFVTMHVSTPET